MAEEICPAYPEVKGISEVEHDGMSNEGHEEQANRAGGQSIKEEDKHEGSPESTEEEKEEEKKED